MMIAARIKLRTAIALPILGMALSACDADQIAPTASPNVAPADTASLAQVATTQAELPRSEIDVRMPAMTGKVIRVPRGGDLQKAINAARPGDVVELQAGATYVGSFKLPPKQGTGWVVIRSSGWQNLPEGERVGPEDARHMAQLWGGQANSRVLKSVAGASHYRLVGLEIRPVPRGAAELLTALVDFERGSHHLILDRSYVHSTPTQQIQRCVVLNSGAAAVINSYIDECHAKRGDSQAIEGWNGTGPYLIENNFLAGAGENIMFGGASIGSGSVPSDITIRRNHIFKPLAWKDVWLVKNLIELKMATRVLIEENVLQNSWPDGQTGFAFVIMSENRDKERRPYIATQDVTIRNNRILNSKRGLAITGKASSSIVTGKGTTSRIRVENNEWRTGSGVAAFQFQGPIPGLIVKHNTAAQGYMDLEASPLTGFVFQDNLLGGRIKASGMQEGLSTLKAKIAPGGIFADNAVVGLSHPELYPKDNGNVYPTSFAAYLGSAGVDLSALSATLQKVLSGVGALLPQQDEVPEEKESVQDPAPGLLGGLL